MRFIALIALLAACGDAGTGLGGRPGDFGQLEAMPECGALSQACIGQGLNAPLAKGSTIDLAIEYKVPGSSGPPTVLASANEAVLRAPSATRLEAVAEGMSAILFTGPEGEVIDIVHVFVQAAAQLRIQRFDASGDLLGQVQPSSQLLVGDELLVAVEPFANGQPLLGNFVLDYRTTSGAIVQILPDPVFGWYRVVARAPGQATVSFAALGLDVAWQIEVLP
jgi:hypothetical protein